MKRSFGSNSSSTSGSNKKTKTKKTNSGNQKTLGAAWGAASSRSSFQSSPFSDFGSYMEVKNRKLQNQFETEAASTSYGVSGSEKLIFQGVSIFVDGFTIPSHQELRGYMMRHGGKFQNYFSRRSVTHIICSNLPDSKVKNLRAFSRGLPVVKPSWIVDSISANRLLGWVPYQLDQLNDTQPKLSAFFAPKSHLTAQLSSPATPFLPEAGYSEAEEGSSIRAEDSEQARDHVDDETDGVYVENTTPEMTEQTRTDEAGYSEAEESSSIRAEDSEEARDHVDDETDGVYVESTTPEMTEQTRTDDLIPSEVNTKRLGNHEREVSSELQSTTIMHSTSDNKLIHDNGKNDGKLIATAVGSSIRRHSTLEDPNFVENYFKNSRLHFIGTWRNRYRKRFHGSSSGPKWADSGQNIDENVTKPTIIHIDLDSFFVSVVIKNRHELHDKPVAVCHSDNPKGTAEISSANYPARAYGVKAGMFVRHAKDLCPQLVIVPYNFEAYEEVADQFYDILHRHCRKVQAVSCDEAFLDVSDIRDVEPEFLASTIRKEILEITGCSASAGIGGTMLMARLATRVAKPAGQFYISAEKVEEFLDQLPVGTLPGVGSVLKEKLEKQNIHTCGQLRLISKDSLQKDFGVKTGEMLWSYSRGLDLRSVTAVQESKSIGAEVNWGVRFRDQQDIQRFLHCLCKEVSLRLQGCEMIGRTFTLKIKKRKKDAVEPAKYMGCGDCDNLSRSITVPAATDDVEVLQRISKKLFGSFCLDVKEVRGVGLQVSKLDSADSSNKGSRTLTSWLNSASASVRTEQDDNVFAAKVRKSSDCKRHDTGGVSRVKESNSAEPSVQSGDTNSSLPAMCHLDIEVLENLPPELLSELDETYGGKLFGLIEKKRGKRKVNSDSPQVSLDDTGGIKGPKSLSEKLHGLNTSEKKDNEESYVPKPSVGRASYDCKIEMTDLIPSSLSQVDVSVLQELPEELRADVLGAFPAHRKQQSSYDAPMEICKKQDKEQIDVKDAENPFSLWFGNPPIWTENFKVSGSKTLEKLSKIYYKVGESKPMLSSVLQHAISESGSFHDDSASDLEKPVHDVCELLKQYIKLKVERDIEEVYVCFRLLKRLAAKSHFFLQVYEILSPFIQALITEHYGGSLHIH